MSHVECTGSPACERTAVTSLGSYMCKEMKKAMTLEEKLTHIGSVSLQLLEVLELARP